MKKILISLEYFYPAYKAGGPVQSITNLILALEQNYTFYVITSAYDLQTETQLKDISVDAWNIKKLPASKNIISVWYAKKRISITEFKVLLTDIQPDIIYVNGIFSFKFFIIPFIADKILKLNTQKVICPRGMLQPGALLGKFLKKKLFLKILQFSGLLKNVTWHATNIEEKNDITSQFVNTGRIIIAPNIPKPPIKEITYPDKKANQLKLVYLSLITEKKNLIFLLTLLKDLQNISLDIYGPIKDMRYWDECKKIIKQNAQRVQYKGDVLPTDVQFVLSNYHAFILLTKGENFGHALYESLSVGRPIITSMYTPWKNLKMQNAGWNINIENKTECISVLKEIEQMQCTEYDKFCNGAYNLATQYYNSLEPLKNYQQLFN